MRQDVELTIEDRRVIRQQAEQVLKEDKIPMGAVTPISAKAASKLLQRLIKSTPLAVECYDLATFQLAGVQAPDDELVRLIADDGTERVMELSGAVVLTFDETIGQAPVIYLATRARPKQPHLYLSQTELPEWHQPVLAHLAYVDGQRVYFTPEDIKRLMKDEMGDKAPGLREILSFLTPGIGAVVHVRPNQFSYRHPELSIERIALWPMDALVEELEELVARLKKIE